MAASELYYEQVKKYFWRKEEADFTIRFSGAEMESWELTPTPTPEDMMRVRRRLTDEGAEFAGFVRYEGRYCFYFRDQHILKVQYLDTGEIDYFRVHSFCEFDLEQVVKEYRLLQGS